MIRIIHVSDLHLENRTPSFDKKHIVEAFAKDIKSYVDDSTLLFFTGDALDKGGIAFKDERDNAFQIFEEFFINAILSENPILKNKIFIVPGNHEVYRDKIDEISEAGLKSNLTSSKNVEEFLIKNRTNPRHLDRLSNYKAWEQSFYSSYPNATLSLFENTFIVNMGGFNIGITCLNSSWLCKDDGDKGNLIIGRNQIENSLDKIKNCHIKLALAHHPLEFLSEVDRDEIKMELFKNYDILFTGHVHELASSYTQDLYGSMFISIVNSTIGDRPKERKFVNGYTILELTPNEKIKTIYKKYLEAHKKFVPNTEIGTDDGTKEWGILKDEKLSKFVEIAGLVDGILNKHEDRLNDDLIVTSKSTNAPCSIDGLFVEPSILNYPQRGLKEADIIEYDIEKILSRDVNFLIYGLKESGKTILLDKLFLEALRKFNLLGKIPIYLKFNDLKSKGIEVAIKEFLGEKKQKVEELLNEQKFIIFIDDFAFSDKCTEQLSLLKDFLKQHTNVQIIGSTDQIIENKLPTDYVEHNDVLKFEIGFIQNLGSTEIKELVTKWFSGKEVDFQENMEKLMKSFLDFGLPKTPLSVTMFLWIFERQENRPLNNSVLVELFIENLLEKANIENIYAETFDFTNKKRFLSFIAKYMRDNGDADLSYSVNYIDLLTFADSYLKTRFTGKPQRVLEDLIKRGILCYEDTNMIRFKSAFFFHYFLALHFDYDVNFKNEVLTGDNYLDYIEEIVYYTGLKRDNVEMLHFTQTKLHEAIGEFNAEVAQNFKKVDTVLEPQEKSQTFAVLLPDEQIAEKPSEKKMDEVYNEQLSVIPVQKNIPKKSGKEYSTKKNVDKVLKLAANVLKNSEDIDDFNAKTIAYKHILLSATSCMIMERDMYIHYYLKYKKSPANLPKNIDFGLFVQVMPLIFQVIMHNWMGTQKLRPVIIDKMEKDKLELAIPEYEKFLSVFMYSDIKGSEYPKKIEEFVESLKFSYTKDLSFLKILSYYHLRNNTADLNNRYLELLYQIKKDLGEVSKQDKSRFLKNIKEQKGEKNA